MSCANASKTDSASCIAILAGHRQVATIPKSSQQWRGEATVATYNSFAGSLVREWGLEVGLETDTAVLTPASSWQIMYELMENWGQEFEEPFSSLDSATELALQVANSLNENLLSVDEARELMADLSQNLKRPALSARGSQSH